MAHHEHEIDDLRSDIAIQIKVMRLERSLTQKQLAERMGTTQVYISNIESGKFGVTVYSMAKIAKAMEARVKITLEDRDV